MKKLALFAMTGALSLASTFLLIPDPADACIHPEKEFKYPIKAGAQKGLILFADGRQEMVIRPSYKVEGDVPRGKAGLVGFNTLAWLVPVPNLPDVYKEADAKLFTKLEEFTKAEENPERQDKKNALGGDWEKRAEHDRAVFLEPVKVGDYEIQPVKASGESGSKELNTWLGDNGFGEVSADVMKYYVDNGYYWLAIKLSNAEGLPADGEVKPLRIGFKTDKPVYPLKINTGRGEFELELWLITNKEVDTDETVPFGLQTIEQQDPDMEQTNRKTRLSALPAETEKIIKDSEGLKALKTGDLYCYRFFGLDMDNPHGGMDLAELKDDLNFKFKEAATPEKKDK